MPKGIGRQIRLGLKKEAVRGTAETSADFYIPVMDASLDERQEKAINEQDHAVIEDSFSMDTVKQWVEGSITAPVTDKLIGLILLNVLGAVSTGDNPDSNAAVKDHTFTVGQSVQHPSLTFFIDDPLGAQDYKHALGMISSIELSYERGQYVRYTVNFKAKKGATQALTPSTSSENRFTHKHVVFKLASDISGLTAASAMTSIKSLNLTISCNIQDDDVLGNVEPVDFINTAISVEGSIVATWQNETDFKTQFMAGTAKAMRIDLINTDVVIGTAANPQLQIDLAKVYFTELSKPVALNDMMVQELSFKATYSAADTKMISAKLTNIQASY